MTVASDNKFPKVLITEGAAPASPSAGDFKLYVDSSDHLFKMKNSSGTVTTFGAGIADQGTATYFDFTTGAAPASPAAGKVRLYSLTGDHLYQKDSGGTATALDAAGGGGTIQYPALKPGTPTYDFASASLDGAFSAHSSQGSFATTNCLTQGEDWGGSSLDMQFSEQMGQIYVAHSNTDFDFEVGGIRTRGLQTASATPQVMIGIAALDSAGTGVGVTVYNDGQIYSATITTWNYATQAASWSSHGLSGISSGDWWLRMKRISGTWTLYASQSGRTWDKTFATRSDSITVDKLAFGIMFNSATAYSGRVIADYFHVTT